MAVCRPRPTDGLYRWRPAIGKRLNSRALCQLREGGAGVIFRLTMPRGCLTLMGPDGGAGESLRPHNGPEEVLFGF